jgi:phenylacetate-CoA ligase
MVASPFYFRTLIKFSEEVRQPLTLKAAFTRSEVLDYPTRKLINDSLGVDVFDGYSAREVGPIAWECPTHSGYHINIDSIVLEILRDGEPISGDETGEVHVTCLWRSATPVIRYRLGDIVTSFDDKCPCGRGLPLLKNIQGRVLDMDVSSDGRLIWRGPKKALKSFINQRTHAQSN